ncbi:MAG: DNA polymerase III subunit beta [Bacilli bacterium]|nr:DNA polymerase III subunit beta [Bacilli bacterium]
MRFTITTEELLKGVSTAGHAIGSSSANAMLSCFKIETTNKGVEITASNGDVSVWTLIPQYRGELQIIRNSTLGAVLIDAKVFMNVIKTLSNQEVSVEVIDNSAIIIDGNNKFSLNCAYADEYPEVDFEKSGTPFVVNTSDLVKLTNQTSFAASDKNRPVLGAINLKAEAGRLVATATDSARLSRKTIDVDPELRFSANVPAKTLSEIVRMFDDDSEVEISASKGRIVFAFGTTVVTSRLISEDYPVSSSIVPSIFNYYLEINSRELLNAIERASILATDKASVIKLTMTPDKVEISSSSDKTGSCNAPLNNVQFTGNRLEIAFNALFVSQAVKALASEDVVFSFVGEMRPFVIKNPQDDSVVELITPMRMR